MSDNKESRDTLSSDARRVADEVEHIVRDRIGALTHEDALDALGILRDRLLAIQNEVD